jgi:hypothetical protein
MLGRVREDVQSPWAVMRGECVKERLDDLTRELTHRVGGEQGGPH